MEIVVTSALVPELAHAWDGLAAGPDDLFASSRWLRYQGIALRLPVTYATAHDGPMLLGGLAMFRLPRPSSRRLYDPRVLFAGRDRAPAVNDDCYLLGSPAGYGNGIPLNPALDERAVVLVVRRLVEALWATVADRPARLYLLYASERTRLRLERAQLVADTIPTLPVHRLDLPGASLDDYLASLSSRRRTRIRRELGRPAAVGYEAGVRPLAELAEVAAPLVGQLEARHGVVMEAAAIRCSLDELSAAFGELALSFFLADRERVLGTLVAVRWKDGLHCRSLGLDYEHLLDAAEYFNLAYYLPAAYAYRHGLSQLHLGPTAGEAKRLRGAVEVPTFGLSVVGEP